MSYYNFPPTQAGQPPSSGGFHAPPSIPQATPQAPSSTPQGTNQFHLPLIQPQDYRYAPVRQPPQTPRETTLPLIQAHEYRYGPGGPAPTAASNLPPPSLNPEYRYGSMLLPSQLPRGHPSNSSFTRDPSTYRHPIVNAANPQVPTQPLHMAPPPSQNFGQAMTQQPPSHNFSSGSPSFGAQKSQTLHGIQPSNAPGSFAPQTQSNYPNVDFKNINAILSRMPSGTAPHSNNPGAPAGGYSAPFPVLQQHTIEDSMVRNQLQGTATLNFDHSKLCFQSERPPLSDTIEVSFLDILHGLAIATKEVLDQNWVCDATSRDKYSFTGLYLNTRTKLRLKPVKIDIRTLKFNLNQDTISEISRRHNEPNPRVLVLYGEPNSYVQNHYHPDATKLRIVADRKYEATVIDMLRKFSQSNSFGDTFKAYGHYTVFYEREKPKKNQY